jgi:uncharacterized membrane protein
MRFPRWLTVALMGLIVLGVVFRFVNLNHKVYWHDEVYTSLRAAGYTRAEIDQDVFQNQEIPAIALQRYQQIKPGSTAADTVRSLAVEDPQHPPLYFLMTRAWMQTLGEPLTAWFKSPLSVTRSLPALLSLLALPAMYGLAWELFASESVALLATTLIALSPYDVLFAQTARQYSLLTVMVILSSYLLLRAIRILQADTIHSSTSKRNVTRHLITWLNWGLYALSLTVGLYTQPFFALTMVSHAVYVAACYYWNPHWRKDGWLIWRFCFGAIATAILLFSPWLMVILTNWQRATATTNWTQVSPGLDYLIKLWILSFTAVFIDLDFGFENPLTILLRVPFLILIGLSIYQLCRRTPITIWLFVVVSIAVPFLLLAIPDLVLGGKRSAVSRYLVSCYPGIQLAVAYFLTTQLAMKRIYSGRSPSLTRQRTPYSLRSAPHHIWQSWFWRVLLALLVISSLVSLTASALAFSWWNKDLSFANHQTADLLNQKPNPIVMSDVGIDYTNTGDLISLSYLLKPDTPLLLLKSADFVGTTEFDQKVQEKTAIAFRPSPSLQEALQQKFGQSTQILKAERLWQVPTIPIQKPLKTENRNKKD